jgi:hypothetical protein
VGLAEVEQSPQDSELERGFESGPDLEPEGPQHLGHLLEQRLGRWSCW